MQVAETATGADAVSPQTAMDWTPGDDGARGKDDQASCSSTASSTSSSASSDDAVSREDSLTSDAATSASSVTDAPRIDTASSARTTSNATKPQPRTEHEVLPWELAPAQPLPPGLIQPQHQLELCGRITAVVDGLVVIESAPARNTLSPLDEGSVLCFADRYPLGEVFETFGSVHRPHYTLRLPATEGSAVQRVVPGIEVYYVVELSRRVDPDRVRVPGCDASNRFSEEVSEEEMEFSDDAKEAVARRSTGSRRRNRQRQRPLQQPPGAMPPGTSSHPRSGYRRRRGGARATAPVPEPRAPDPRHGRDASGPAPLPPVADAHRAPLHLPQWRMRPPAST
ncbi:hypothetical protein CDCA_CDCA17G4376 [Cyanidium caldarium]|uniref:H/ACA ribonucleoprotein complex subunit n=1 Tax=Cyanidium caldarium TaxID=2771 RepID=A0AAV9J1R3_CYACA|nr:hypothetical protein CDCA_CDCA17G4376 [Cyanidium caldarium]